MRDRPAVPPSVVEAGAQSIAARMETTLQECDGATRSALLGDAQDAIEMAIADPAFAPWFLRRMSETEPTVAEIHYGDKRRNGPYVADYCYSDEPSDRELHWFVRNGLDLIGPFDTEDEARTVAGVLNALAGEAK